MNRCGLHVGRLIEIRAETGYRSLEDVDDIFAQIGREAAKRPPDQKLVIITDWRRCPVMSKEASEYILPKIVGSNARVERSATIASKNSPTAIMQFGRLIRSSQNPDRRIFFDTIEVTAWLDEILNPEERARLRAFLAHEEP